MPSPPFIEKPDEQGLDRAAGCLRRGGVVAFPTESSYGLAVDATSAEALSRLVALKGRPESLAFPLLVAGREQAEALVGRLEGPAALLVERSWPGSLTLVAPPLMPLPSEVISDLGVGVRVPAHPVAARLAIEAKGPITATSANPSGLAPAMTSTEVAEAFGDRVDLILDGGPSGGQPPSTVVSPHAWGLLVLREGLVPVEEGLRLTRDGIFRSRYPLLQPMKGYRFSVDALILAAFAASLLPRTRQGAGPRVMDLGCGCGVVSLALCHHHPGCSVLAMELMPRLADLAVRNVEMNRMEDRISVLTADARKLKGAHLSGRFDWVVSNPPYRAVGTGRTSPDPERAAALSEQTLTVDELCSAARLLLGDNGKVALVYPADRLARLLVALSAADLAPFMVRSVHPRPGAPARRVLVAARKTGSEVPLKIEQPLFMQTEDGTDTDELAAIVTGVQPS